MGGANEQLALAPSQANQSAESADSERDAGNSWLLFTGSCLLDGEQNSPAGEKKAIRQLEPRFCEDPTSLCCFSLFTGR